MYTWRELVALYRLTDSSPPSNLQPRYNICPTTTIDAVIERDSKRVLEQMRWGLVPSWWNKALKELRLATFNARAETVAEKPFYRSAFKRTRCLIPVSGYYEWQTVGKEKQPYYFTRRDGQIITIAGLWSEWTNPETSKPQSTCTMIITEPNKFVAGVHDRMPVILEEKQFEPWLDDSAVPTSLVTMLKPAGERTLVCHPVSTRVNSSRADETDAALIKDIAP
jgi:putative SOS response-associated peptidase YedK